MILTSPFAPSLACVDINPRVCSGSPKALESLCWRRLTQWRLPVQIQSARLCSSAQAQSNFTADSRWGQKRRFWRNSCCSGATWLCLASAAPGRCGTWLCTTILRSRVDSQLRGFLLSQIFLRLAKSSPRERHGLMLVWHSLKSLLPVIWPQPGIFMGRNPRSPSREQPPDWELQDFLLEIDPQDGFESRIILHASVCLTYCIGAWYRMRKETRVAYLILCRRVYVAH